MKTEYTIELSKKKNALIIIEAMGQQCPAVGNDVQVTVTVDLPAETENSYTKIIPELCFGSKVRVMGEELYSDWGNAGSSDNDRRWRTEAITGKTWKEAVQSAAQYAKTELIPLIHALAEREQALLDAGDWV